MDDKMRPLLVNSSYRLTFYLALATSSLAMSAYSYWILSHLTEKPDSSLIFQNIYDKYVQDHFEKQDVLSLKLFRITLINLIQNTRWKRKTMDDISNTVISGSYSGVAWKSGYSSERERLTLSEATRKLCSFGFLCGTDSSNFTRPISDPYLAGSHFVTLSINDRGTVCMMIDDKPVSAEEHGFPGELPLTMENLEIINKFLQHIRVCCGVTKRHKNMKVSKYIIIESKTDKSGRCIQNIRDIRCCRVLSFATIGSSCQLCNETYRNVTRFANSTTVNKQQQSASDDDANRKEETNERPPLDKKTKKAVTKRIRESLRKKPKERPSCLPDDATTPIVNPNTLSPKRKKAKASQSSLQSDDPDTPKAEKRGSKAKGKSVKEKANKDVAIEDTPAKKRKLTDNGQSPESVPCSKDIITPTTFLSDGFKFDDSAMAAERLFDWMINPVKSKNFFSKLWEKKPLLVKRHSPNYNYGWFSTEEMDRILRENELDFTRNIDVTTYTDGQRETHNPVGRAHASVVWDFYKNGCSVRLLNPQTYSKSMWKLNSTLQEYFGSCVGANVYLTPPGSQGFAPHYDDIEAFVLQLEGKKHWRLYSPRTDEETLPRYSSDNFKEEDIGEPILDVILEAGDLLYFPRGTIHQADTAGDSHSLHITVSTCQKNSWGDLLEKLVPRALQVAFEEDVEFRRSLPRDYLNYMGVANSDSDDPMRAAFLNKVAQLMMKVISYAPVDAATDQMALGFIHDSLPPVITDEEKERCVFGNGAQWKDGKVTNECQIEEDTEIKIIRRGAIRLITEEEKVLVYYTLENSRVYHEKEPQFIEIPAEAGLAVEHLLNSYPDFVRVDSLPLEDLPGKQVEIAQVMYERGILIAKEPLKPVS